MLGLTGHFESASLLGMTLHPDNPLLFDFLIDRGQDKLENQQLKVESEKLIKFFLASMTIPDNDAWVNLSPYEKDRIMPDLLATTDMGKTMLEQDYLLKQLSASLTNPEKDLGKKFWDEVQKRAFERFGKTEMPMNTFNKVWIVPQSALVLEHEGYVLVGDSHLKVMLDQDYVALARSAESLSSAKGVAPASSDAKDEVSTLSSEVFRETILPQLEKEVNEGKTFAPVRQIYHSVILATWYKKNLKESLLGKVYVDKNKIAGVNISEKDIKEKIYQQYLEAFRKGVYNLIKEDEDLATKETLPRKYFSGGLGFESASSAIQEEVIGRNNSAPAKAAIERFKAEADDGRVASAAVTLADDQKLAKSLGDQVAANARGGNSASSGVSESNRVDVSYILGAGNKIKIPMFMNGSGNDSGEILVSGLGSINFKIVSLSEERGRVSIVQTIEVIPTYGKPPVRSFVFPGYSANMGPVSIAVDDDKGGVVYVEISVDQAFKKKVEVKASLKGFNPNNVFKESKDSIAFSFWVNELAQFMLDQGFIAGDLESYIDGSANQNIVDKMYAFETAIGIKEPGKWYTNRKDFMNRTKDDIKEKFDALGTIVIQRLNIKTKARPEIVKDPLKAFYDEGVKRFASAVARKLEAATAKEGQPVVEAKSVAGITKQIAMDVAEEAAKKAGAKLVELTEPGLADAVRLDASKEIHVFLAINSRAPAELKEYKITFNGNSIRLNKVGDTSIPTVVLRQNDSLVLGREQLTSPKESEASRNAVSRKHVELEWIGDKLLFTNLSASGTGYYVKSNKAEATLVPGESKETQLLNQLLNAGYTRKQIRLYIEEYPNLSTDLVASQMHADFFVPFYASQGITKRSDKMEFLKGQDGKGGVRALLDQVPDSKSSGSSAVVVYDATLNEVTVNEDGSVFEILEPITGKELIGLGQIRAGKDILITFANGTQSLEITSRTQPFQVSDPITGRWGESTSSTQAELREKKIIRDAQGKEFSVRLILDPHFEVPAVEIIPTKNNKDGIDVTYVQLTRADEKTEASAVSSSAIILAASDKSVVYLAQYLREVAIDVIREINDSILYQAESYKDVKAKPKLIDFKDLKKAIDLVRTEENLAKLPWYAQAAYSKILNSLEKQWPQLKGLKGSAVRDALDQMLLGESATFRHEFLLNGAERLATPLTEGDTVVVASEKDRFYFTLQKDRKIFYSKSVDGEKVEWTGNEILTASDNSFQIQKLGINGSVYLGIRHLPSSTDSTYVLVNHEQPLDVEKPKSKAAVAQRNLSTQIIPAPAPAPGSIGPRVVPATRATVVLKKGVKNLIVMREGEEFHLVLVTQVPGKTEEEIKGFKKYLVVKRVGNALEIKREKSKFEVPPILINNQEERILGREELTADTEPREQKLAVSTEHFKISWNADQGGMSITDISTFGTGFFPSEAKAEKVAQEPSPVRAMEALAAKKAAELNEADEDRDDETLPPDYDKNSASSSLDNVGGINFDPTLFNLQIKRDGKGVPLPLPQQNLEQINIEGLYPVIINIKPATMQNFPFLISALDQKEPLVASN